MAEEIKCCEEGTFAHKCEGEKKSCGLCHQTCCFYHGCSNNNGVKGGHARCTQSSCATSLAFLVNCEGHMAQCPMCRYWYCAYHSQGVAAGTLTGGHVCNVVPEEPKVLKEEACISLAVLSSVIYEAENFGSLIDKYAPLQARLENIKNEYGYEWIPGSVATIINSPDGSTTENICQMAVFRNVNNGGVVLAIKGTSNWFDVGQDFQMIKGGPGSVEATRLTRLKANELILKYGVNLITGHSLGGYYAEIIATNEHFCGVSFSNPGVNGPKVKLGGVPVRGFQNINFEHDWAGNALTGYYQHVQWSVFIGNDGLLNHSIDVMVEQLKLRNRRTLTNMDVVSRSTGYPTGWYNPE